MNFGTGISFITTQATYFFNLTVADGGDPIDIFDPNGNHSTGIGLTQISNTNPVSMCFLDQVVFFASGVSTIGTMSTSTLICSTLQPTVGTVPPFCTLDAAWRGRLCLAGDINNPQNFYMSRLGVPTDWNYAATDGAAAVAGNLSQSGQIGEPITCIIPFNDDLMIISTVDSVWLLEGDPADGGSIVRLTREGGILGPYSWTIDPVGNLYYITTAGLWKVNPIWSVYRPPELMSGQGFSQFFENLNPNLQTITMSWDAQNKYIKIFVTPSPVGAAGVHIIFDTRNGGYWPFQYPANIGPTCVAGYISGNLATTQIIALGGQDGKVYTESTTALDDVGTAILASATYSPFQFAPVGDFVLNRLEVDCGEQNANFFGITSTSAGGEIDIGAGSTDGFASTGITGTVDSTNTVFSTAFSIIAGNIINAFYVDTQGNTYFSPPASISGPLSTVITLVHPIVSTISGGLHSTVGYVLKYLGTGSTFNLPGWNMNISVVAGGTAADVSNDGFPYPTLDSTSNLYATWATSTSTDRRQSLMYPRLLGSWFGVTVSNSTDSTMFSVERITCQGVPAGTNRYRR
jgi:hypothetical protein